MAISLSSVLMLMGCVVPENEKFKYEDVITAFGDGDEGDVDGWSVPLNETVTVENDLNIQLKTGVVGKDLINNEEIFFVVTKARETVFTAELFMYYDRVASVHAVIEFSNGQESIIYAPVVDQRYGYRFTVPICGNEITGIKFSIEPTDASVSEAESISEDSIVQIDSQNTISAKRGCDVLLLGSEGRAVEFLSMERGEYYVVPFGIKYFCMVDF